MAESPNPDKPTTSPGLSPPLVKEDVEADKESGSGALATTIVAGAPIPAAIAVSAQEPRAAAGAVSAQEPADIVTTSVTMTDPVSPLSAEAKAAARKRLKQTAIGIAPPAFGSQKPPETKSLGGSTPRPTAGVPTSTPTSPASKPPVPSKPPPVPAKPAPLEHVEAAEEVKAEGPDHPHAAATKSASFVPAPAFKGRVGGATLIGATAAPALLGGPSPIVPRRRTPSKGMPAAGPVGPSKLPGSPPGHRVTPMAGTAIPKITPAAGSPPDPIVALTDSADDAERSGAAEAVSRGFGGGAPIVVEVKEKDISAQVVPPPIIRIPQGGLLGSSSPSKTDRSGTLICEILVKNGSIPQEMVDKALGLQEERGGQIGRILVSIGACTEDAIARALIEQLKIRKNEGFLSDVSTAARERKDVLGLKVLTRPVRTVVVLLLTDIFSLLLAALIATTVHWLRTYSELQTIDWTAWLVVGPSIALCLLTFLGLELYSPMAKSTPDEIRDITFAASLVHLGASVLATLGDLPIVRWGVFVRGVWWAATLFLVPVVRSLVRNYFSVQPWWGIPVCVLGAAKTGRLIVRTLKAQPRSGLKPVMLLDDDIAKFGTLRASFTNEVMDVYSVNVSAAHFLTESQRAEFSSDIFGDEGDRASAPISSDHIPIAAEAWQTKVDVTVPQKKSAGAREDEFFGPDSQKVSRSQITKDASQFPRGKFAEVDGVPLVGDLSLAPILAHRLKIPYAVLAMPGVDSTKLLQIVERIGGKFTHLLIIPDLFGFATMGVPAKSLGGILGVEIRQQLLLPGPRLAKRIIDGALTGIGIFFVLPFLLLIAALIKLDSKGPIFYTQKRLGKDGSYFSAYKFRTMHGDGEARLKAILDSDPALRAEYDIYHKLRKDPRVTRIGRILRKFSLDEFPQLLNVMTGDMSLVGPRPYIERELTEMGGQEKIILRAPPGMTGMWQVSDRNATSFAQRVQIDVYYVRNWSPWLDIHILAKTFGVVIKGSGV